MSDIADEIARLIAADRKIDAIQRVREATGMGLADAKSVVDRLAAGQPVSLAPRANAPIDDELAEEIRTLVADDKAIAAIKLLRQRTGCGLKDARERVEELTGTTIGPRLGCGAAAVLLAVAAGSMAAGSVALLLLHPSI